MSSNLSQHDFFEQFIVMNDSGELDRQETMRRFEAAVTKYVKSEEDIKPVILAEIIQWGRIAEGTLINFSLHSLKLPVTNENRERVKHVLKELIDAHKIEYHTNENGGKRGRNSGYSIASPDARANSVH